jgi:hypothetical protein
VQPFRTIVVDVAKLGISITLYRHEDKPIEDKNNLDYKISLDERYDMMLYPPFYAQSIFNTPIGTFIIHKNAKGREQVPIYIISKEQLSKLLSEQISFVYEGVKLDLPNIGGHDVLSTYENCEKQQ